MWCKLVLDYLKIDVWKNLVWLVVDKCLCDCNERFILFYWIGEEEFDFNDSFDELIFRNGNFKWVFNGI